MKELIEICHTQKKNRKDNCMKIVQVCWSFQTKVMNIHDECEWPINWLKDLEITNYQYQKIIQTRLGYNQALEYKVIHVHHVLSKMFITLVWKDHQSFYQHHFHIIIIILPNLFLCTVCRILASLLSYSIIMY